MNVFYLRLLQDTQRNCLLILPATDHGDSLLSLLPSRNRKNVGSAETPEHTDHFYCAEKYTFRTHDGTLELKRTKKRVIELLFLLSLKTHMRGIWRQINDKIGKLSHYLLNLQFWAMRNVVSVLRWNEDQEIKQIDQRRFIRQSLGYSFRAGSWQNRSTKSRSVHYLLGMISLKSNSLTLYISIISLEIKA